MATTVTLKLRNPQEAMALYGHNDETLKLLKRTLNVDIVARGGNLKLSGDQTAIDHAERTFNHLLALIRKGREVSLTDIERGTLFDVPLDDQGDSVVASLPRRARPKTAGQRRYVTSIASHDITFGIGPAGTGKTFLAIAMAVQALKDKTVKRIVLTRPAVEAGEKLGFLPGDLQAKIDPYLRPLYDALYDMMEHEKVDAYLESGVIEVAPLAFMRGRTLNDAFVILDEAQNTTGEQMKMFLTRMGFNGRVVVTGDITQTDLPTSVQSGLQVSQHVLRNIEGIGFVYFGDKDVVRHPLVAKIIKAYDTYQVTIPSARQAARNEHSQEENAQQGSQPPVPVPPTVVPAVDSVEKVTKQQAPAVDLLSDVMLSGVDETV